MLIKFDIRGACYLMTSIFSGNLNEYDFRIMVRVKYFVKIHIQHFGFDNSKIPELSNFILFNRGT